MPNKVVLPPLVRNKSYAIAVQVLPGGDVTLNISRDDGAVPPKRKRYNSSDDLHNVTTLQTPLLIRQAASVNPYDHADYDGLVINSGGLGKVLGFSESKSYTAFCNMVNTNDKLLDGASKEFVSFTAHRDPKKTYVGDPRILRFLTMKQAVAVASDAAKKNNTTYLRNCSAEAGQARELADQCLYRTGLYDTGIRVFKWLDSVQHLLSGARGSVIAVMADVVASKEELTADVKSQAKAPEPEKAEPTQQPLPFVPEGRPAFVTRKNDAGQITEVVILDRVDSVRYDEQEDLTTIAMNTPTTMRVNGYWAELMAHYDA
jgi:hypothetical protein